MFCIKCGSQNDDNSKFCVGCGAQLGTIQPPKKKPNAGLIVALVIAGVLVLTGIATASFFVTRAITSESTDVDGDDKKSDSKKEVNKVEDDKEKEEAAKKEEEEKARKEEEERAKKEEKLKVLNAKGHRAFGDILIAYICGSEEDSGLSDFDFSDNWDGRGSDKYAIYDIDSDGLDELLLFSENTYTANMQLNIFYYDEQKDKAVCANSRISPIITLYDNGVIRCDDLHNHTFSEIWPYYIYKYDAENKSCDVQAGVSAWQKSFSETNYDGTSFPDDVDVDGNGCVYCIYNNGNSEYMDDADYEKWFEEMIDGGVEVQLSTREVQNYYEDDNITSEYKKYLIDGVTELCGDNNDLGLAYINSCLGDGDFKSLTGSYVQYISKDEYDMEYEGAINGVAAVDYYPEDGGSVAYIQAVDGVTLFGISPGDTVDDAIKKLESIGFHQSEDAYSDDYLFINGVHTVSYGVFFEQTNGVITKISISYYSRFVG